jgi:Mn2+/Fe2+ NRAMP family transporter
MNPIKALYYSAVVNGLVAVPIIAMMMLIAANEKVMGQFTIRGWLKILGWATALLMAMASVAMIVDFF